MDDKIVLDRKSFEALAVDTRVRILKSLKQRRKTLSEIAKEQNMSASGIKEHLAVLESVGLIEKIDDGHKWKYYELTKKGNEIIGPKEIKVWILLSISTFALIASMFTIFTAPMMLPQSMEAGMEEAAVQPTAFPVGDREVMAAYNAVADSASSEPDEKAAADTTVGETEEAGPGLKVPMAVAAISALVIVSCLGILVRNRLSTSP